MGGLTALAALLAGLAAGLAVWPGPAAAQAPEGDRAAQVERRLGACAGLADDGERLACFDRLAEEWRGDPQGGTVTAAGLVAAACGSDPACQRHGAEYRIISPTAGVLEVLVSACAKIRGEARVDCLQRGLEGYPRLSDGEILRGNETGRTAQRLRALAGRLLAACEPRDAECLQEAMAVLGGQLTP